MDTLKPPKINSFISHEKNNFPSKNMYKIYKTFHVLFGFNFGFFEFANTKLNFFCKYFTSVFSLAACVLCFIYQCYHSKWDAILWISLYFTKFMAYILILHITKNQMCNGLRAIGYIDRQLKVDCSKYYSEVNILVPLFLSIFFRVTLTTVYCHIGNECAPTSGLSISYITLLICEDFVSTTYSFVFLSIYNRLKTLKSKVMEADKTELKYYHCVYKLLADVAEDLKKSFDPLFLMALIYIVPEIMITAYNIVLNARNNMSIVLAASLESQLLYAVLMVSLSFTVAPALCAGRLAAKAYELQVILHDKWLQEEDPNEAKDIIKFADYVEARPLTFNAYKVIPLNTQVLSLVVNFCVTYLIVLIQFTL